MMLQQLIAQPQNFDFVQAIRLLQNQAPGQHIQLTAEIAPLGPEAPIQTVESQDKKQLLLRLCMGALSGARGVLPDHFYAQLLKNHYQGSHAMQAFLDIFNQRVYELEYRRRIYSELITHPKVKNGHSLSKQQHKLTPEPAITSFYQAMAIPDSLKNVNGVLRYGLLLQMKDSHPRNLKALLSDYFDCQFAIDFDDINYQQIPLHCRTKIGNTQGQNNRLKQSLVLGKKTKLYQRALQVLIKPKDHQNYLKLKDDQHFIQQVTAFIRAFIGDCGLFKVYFYIRQSYLPRSQLGKNLQIGKRHYLLSQHNNEQWVKIAP